MICAQGSVLCASILGVGGVDRRRPPLTLANVSFPPIADIRRPAGSASADSTDHPEGSINEAIAHRVPGCSQLRGS
jgi:hypothetical protein